MEISAEDRDMVEGALARGWSNARIAQTLGISPASLKRHFRAALQIRDVARDRLELAAFSTIAREAIGGNMTAMKQLREMMAADALTAKKADMQRRQEEAKAAGLGLGKKEMQQRAAEDAVQDDGWGDIFGAGGLH